MSAATVTISATAAHHALALALNDQCEWRKRLARWYGPIESHQDWGLFCGAAARCFEVLDQLDAVVEELHHAICVAPYQDEEPF